MKTKGLAATPEMFHRTLDGQELPFVTPVDMMQAAATEEAVAARFAATGERRNNNRTAAEPSAVLTEDMGLDRPIDQGAVIPNGRPLELPGKHGRRSGHSRPLTTAEMRLPDAQVAANRAGVAVVRAVYDDHVLAAQTETASTTPDVLRDEAGRVVLGAAAKPWRTETTPTEPGTKLTKEWVDGFVAATKAGLKR